MRKDPFAELSGLDQKLFSSTPKVSNKSPADSSKEPKKERPNVRRKETTFDGKTERTFQRSIQPTKELSIERRSFDFFRYQVLGLNRIKLEIQERHALRVSVNAMVQLAVDLLIEDYKRRKERSKLMTKLVFNQSTEERPSGRM